MCRVLYRLLVSLACLAVRSGRSKDLEVIALRHRLRVLRRRTTDRPSPMRICFVISEIRYSLLVTDSKIVAISTILDLRTAPPAVVLNVCQSA